MSTVKTVRTSKDVVVSCRNREKGAYLAQTVRVETIRRVQLSPGFTRQEERQAAAGFTLSSGQAKLVT